MGKKPTAGPIQRTVDPAVGPASGPTASPAVSPTFRQNFSATGGPIDRSSAVRTADRTRSGALISTPLDAHQSGEATGAKIRAVRRRSLSIKLTAAVLWLFLTVALATWWMIFGIHQIRRFMAAQAEANPQLSNTLTNEIARQHRMLVSEGATLIILLLAGGAALLYFIFSEVRRARRIQNFFAAFTHDLKTSLASLRLQAESLEEDLKDSGQNKIVRRLVKDTVRLELQLENSLLLASPEDSLLLIEDCDIEQVLKPLLDHWPELEIVLRGDGVVQGDARALESIFKNLFQNAIVHGRANRVDVAVETGDPGRLRIRIEDNGRGFSGDRAKLGEMFRRHSSTSGSGLGLYLAQQLTLRMNGQFRVTDVPSGGFGVEIALPGFEDAPHSRREHK